ncbi:hypothetical protein, partial [Serratia marcescens]|uniref:hypothetical protein n=1 Tax=Serratia marcescens TaxID=615 RepID=UPI003172DF06
NNYFPEDLLGFNLSVFPGVFLLSRWRWSGCPVDSAIRFGPGLRALMDILHRVKRKLYNCIYRQLKVVKMNGKIVFCSLIFNVV